MIFHSFRILCFNIMAYLVLASAYSTMSREKEARAEAAEVLRINTKFWVDSWAKKSITSLYKDQSEIDEVVDALRKAGLK